MEFKHLPVMLNECMDGLNLHKNAVYFDGTLGGGGHSGEILKRTDNSVRLIATALDDDALLAATEKLKIYGDRFTAVKSNFKNFNEVLDNLGIDEIDGVLLDLGVSSYQLDNRSRGFSYMGSAKLDMRMDKTQSYSAYDFINEASFDKLKYAFITYGEEKFAHKVAENILKARALKPIETTDELVKICDESIPPRFRDGHSAKKVFQAVRIVVNEELDGLEQAIRDMIKRLKKGGRIAIITFHSLEDRIVKTVFKDLSTACICDKRFPCVCGRKQIIKEITRKPVTASEQELAVNSRSKCAKLRIAEKL